MIVKNILLGRVKFSNVDTFTTKTGLKLRRYINPGVRLVLKMAAKNKLVIDSYPNLNPDEPYIFATTHYFDEDIISSLASIDRNAYILLGTTDQIEHNPQSYFAWINGMIYVNRLDPQSRKDSILKQIRVLESGTSVLMFPEGGLNNTENLLVQPLFAGPYILAKETGKKVVPMATFYAPELKEVHIMVGEPLDIGSLEKDEALSLLRDQMATMQYTMIEKYSTPLMRDSLASDYHTQFMQDRVDEYLQVKWTRDVWDEELSTYRDKRITYADDVRKSFDKVVLTKDNIGIMYPIVRRRIEDEKYNFKKYIKTHWQNNKGK